MAKKKGGKKHKREYTWFQAFLQKIVQWRKELGIAVQSLASIFVTIRECIHHTMSYCQIDTNSLH